MSNPGGSVGPGDVKAGSSSVKPPVPDGGPIIEESQESEEYQQDLKVVVGTTIGVIAFVGLVVVAILLYRVYRARQRALAYSHHNDDSLDRNISMDIGGEKCQPVVFLLYANDCPLHQRVVEALAGFLMEVCGVTVTLDILEEADIIERGIDDWLVDRLQEADYIMVMCSLGARLRCSKKHVRFKPIGQHLLPDYFSVAVDYVAEKMRVEKQKSLCTDKFMVAYMDYSTQSDIPPQLETASRFCLMKDIHKLHTYLKTCGPESIKSDSGSQHSNSGGGGGGGGSSSGGDCHLHYHETETGALLKATIEQTKAYFKENPSWIDDRLEQSTSSAIPHWVGMGKSRKRQQQQQHNSIEEPLLLLTNSLPQPPPPSQSVHNLETCCNQRKSIMSNRRWSSKLSADIDLNLINDQISSSMGDVNEDYHPHHPYYHHHHQHPHHHDYHCNQTDIINSKNCLSKSGGGGGIFQARQNSLPSSLTSSGAIPSSPASKRDQLAFRSMDNFCLDSGKNGDRNGIPADHDGVPCLFCSCRHIDGVPECKFLVNGHGKGLKQPRRRNDDDINYESVHNLAAPTADPALTSTGINNINNNSNNNDNTFSHSQTILQAEVHQEWGTPVRKPYPKDGNNDYNIYNNNNNSNNSHSYLTGKSNTYGGHLRCWDSGQDVSLSAPPQPVYKSLPANHPPPTSSMLSEWDDLGLVFNGKNHTWDNDADEETYGLESEPHLQHTNTINRMVGGGGGGGGRGNSSYPYHHHHHHHPLHTRSRTLSQSSVYTNGSESLSSDTDSLKRDLQSIQNISSFQDFVNSSLFVTEPHSGAGSERLPALTHLIPSLTSSSLLKPFQKFTPPPPPPSSSSLPPQCITLSPAAPSPVENGRGVREGEEGIEMQQVRMDCIQDV